ncbi:MAG: hypothetical protein ABIO92_10515 [Chloroflexia bacterium]
MEQEGIDSRNADSPAAQDETDDDGGQGDTASSGGFSTHASTRREPTILTMQDLIDLPRQILPEETYIHLRNACREAALAAFSLWRTVDKARKGNGTKVRTHIDVE